MKQIFAILVAFTLAGCAGAGTSVFQGGSSVFAPIANPVTNEQVAAVVGAYGSALVVLNAYKSLPLCKTGQTESLGNLCARRSVIVKLQDASRKARFAINTLANFRKNYPQLSAIDALNAARAAVDDFRNTAIASGVRM